MNEANPFETIQENNALSCLKEYHNIGLSGVTEAAV